MKAQELQRFYGQPNASREGEFDVDEVAQVAPLMKNMKLQAKPNDIQKLSKYS